MSPAQLRNLRLPPDAPRRMRLGVYLTRFLAHHNRLDGALALFAVYWGTVTILWPDFWGQWPVTALLAARTGGHPAVVSWTLLLAGTGSYIARRFAWHWLRTISALAAFGTWSMLAWIFASVDPMFSPGFACYSYLAFAKFVSYLNFVINVDQREYDEPSVL